MTLVAVLGAAWAVCAAVPLWWWWRRGRRPDLWAALPLPAVLLDRAGRVRWSSSSVADPASLRVPAPPDGSVRRDYTADGRPLAVRGVAGGALVVGWPDGEQTLAAGRDRLAADLTLRLAHDLATPLTAVRGHLELLAHEPLAAAARRSVELATAQVERAGALTSDVVTLTALRAGSAATTVELAGALAEEAAIGLLDRADRLGARLEIATPAVPVRVGVVAGAMVRALRNLVSNALEYGLGEQLEVWLSVSCPTPASVRFEVADSGPGLSAQELVRLSQPRARGSDAPPAGPGRGLGLGLAIVAEVLSAHASVLVTEPAAQPGLGRSRLWFELPTVPGARA